MWQGHGSLGMFSNSCSFEDNGIMAGLTYVCWTFVCSIDSETHLRSQDPNP